MGDTMHKKLIIFDCFGVIFGEVAPLFLRKYLTEEEATAVKDKIFVPADLGQITYDELLDTLALTVKADKAEVTREWNKLFVLKEDTVELIKRLKKTADIALLSNAPLGLVEKMFDEYGLTSLFDKMVISSAVKLAKPNPEIYRYCVAQFGKEYDEIYMIDDNIGNLEPLAELGITPVHFTGIESVLTALAKE